MIPTHTQIQAIRRVSLLALDLRRELGAPLPWEGAPSDDELNDMATRAEVSRELALLSQDVTCDPPCRAALSECASALTDRRDAEALSAAERVGHRYPLRDRVLRALAVGLVACCAWARWDVAADALDAWERYGDEAHAVAVMVRAGVLRDTAVAA
jgi:hypothetical protein